VQDNSNETTEDVEEGEFSPVCKSQTHILIFPSINRADAHKWLSYLRAIPLNLVKISELSIIQ
jgi:hypothetical protein